MSQRNYEEECGDYGGNDGECGLAAGWGTDFEDGKCKHHRGTSPDGSSHEGNGNAITHGATADPVNLYRHLTDDEREWVDALVAGYLEEAPFGEDSPKVERLRMTCTIIYQEWSAREAVLREGMSEDTVVGVSDDGAPIVRTDEHHLTDTAGKHNQTVRMNLKDLGLLDDPDSQHADAAGDVADALRQWSKQADANEP